VEGMTSSSLKEKFHIDGSLRVEAPEFDVSLSFQENEININVTRLNRNASKLIPPSLSKRIMLKKISDSLTDMGKTLNVSLMGEIAFVIGRRATPSLLSRVGLLPGLEVKSIKTSAKLMKGLYNEF
jgi:hypothetical protein